MSTNANIKAVLTAALLGLPLLSGCGGADGTDGSSGTDNDGDGASASASQGSVAVFLTDAPADPDDFSAINIQLTRVELIPEDDEGDPVVVREDAPVTVDLMDLTHEAIPLSYREGVPEGEYCRVVLTVESLELVLAAGGSEHPELPADGRITLIPEDCFEVEADAVAHVQLDLDVGRSILEEDGEYILRPVFYVEVVQPGERARVVRLQGEITDYDADDERLLLCGSMPVRRGDHPSAHDGCAWVQVTSDTGFFDNINAVGAPRALAELFRDANLGETATVAGVVKGFRHGYLDLRVPPGHFPPPGECKLWHPRRPPGLQPSPAPCDHLLETAPEDTVVIDHDGRIVLDRRGLVSVDALAVEMGEFLQVDGTAAGTPVGGQFHVNLRPGEPIASDEPLPVRLQEAPSGGNGTRIVSKTGELLAAGDIDAEESVSIDGVFVTGTQPSYLNAALVILDDALQALQRLSGTVLTVTEGGATVATDSAEDNPCADAPGDVMISVDEDTHFLTVTVTDTDSTSAQGGELAPDQQVDIYGECTVDGTFDAHQVVIINDTRGD